MCVVLEAVGDSLGIAQHHVSVTRHLKQRENMKVEAINKKNIKVKAINKRNIKVKAINKKNLRVSITKTYNSR